MHDMLRTRARPVARCAAFVAGAVVGTAMLWQSGSALAAAWASCRDVVGGKSLVPPVLTDVALLAQREADAAAQLLRAHCTAGDDVVISVQPIAAGATAAEKVRVLAYPIRVFDVQGYLTSTARGARTFHLALTVADQPPPPLPPVVQLREIARNDCAVLSAVAGGPRSGR